MIFKAIKINLKIFKINYFKSRVKLKKKYLENFVRKFENFNKKSWKKIYKKKIRVNPNF
jgi:hypothetical protein